MSNISTKIDQYAKEITKSISIRLVRLHGKGEKQFHHRFWICNLYGNTSKLPILHNSQLEYLMIGPLDARFNCNTAVQYLKL